MRAKKFFAAFLATALTVSGFAVGSPVTAKAASAEFTSVGGFSETIYAQISGVKDADVTGVSYSGTASGELTGQDLEYLVREKNGGVRVDIPGVKPGTYTLTVTTKSGTITKSGISVDAQDRSGYAHFNYTAGVGAYNDDGTLKDNAIVLYVTDDNKNSVELTYGGTTVKGIGNILNSVGKECGEAGHEGQCKKTSGNKTIYAKANTNQGIIQKLAENNVPLVVRFIGTVSDSGLYKRGTFNASTGLIDGLTAYDGDDFGGSVGDNGHMARIKSGRDITLEGIGTDAAIDGWGFHFMAESAQPDLGKSFEVRNLKFINTPEDAIGMEGVQVSANVNSDLSASVERCWIHNNEFYCPDISNPAESDKSEGDGSVDFKRGQYFTCSYNYFEGCHKTNLVGSADSSLQFNLTYHHNYWKLCKARGPLTRNSNVHMYNNIYEGQTDYAMNVRANAYIFSEYNLFYMCKNPQRVDSGAIKSYNDSFSSCINQMDGTVVANKTDAVANNCKFAAKGIDYSKFDTDSSLSYIPTGDYELQTSITEAHKAIASRTGVLKENPVAAGDVSMSSISYVPSGVTPVNVTELPSTLTPGKLNKTVYAFTVGGTVDVTVKYADDTLAGTGALVNEAGECFLVASGTARNLPAGTYMIQPYNFQPGDGKTMQSGTFKQVTIDSLEITSSDPNAHYHKYELVETIAATCTSEGSKIYRCSCGDTKTEPVAKLDHTYGAWTVTKEATETETGLKVRKCTVCGCEDSQKIPAKGTSGGDSSEPAEAGAYAHNFTTSGTASSVYTITGSTTTSKGSVTYAGLTLTTALKMESKTGITFTAPSAGKLVLVFGGSTAASGKTVKVNGDRYTCGSDGIATVEVKAGEVTITKGDSINLFYMNFEADGSSTTDPTEPANPDIPSADKKNGLLKSDDGSWYYYVDDAIDTSKTGLVQNNDAWWYVESGKLQSDYKGFVENGAGKWYVVNGKINTDFTGLGKDGDDWVCVRAGKADSSYTGLVKNSDYFWYVKDGKLDTSYLGTVTNDGGTWFIINGKLDTSVTGIKSDKTDFWYVKGGKVDTAFEGVIEQGGSWWYVKDGKVAKDYKGLFTNAAGTWYVAAGKIDTSFTGLGKDGDNWVCVRAGKVDRTYTGLVQSSGIWWYVSDGVLDTSYTGIQTNDGGSWLVVKGKLNTDYTGEYTVDSTTYNIVNGKVTD